MKARVFLLYRQTDSAYLDFRDYLKLSFIQT